MCGVPCIDRVEKNVQRFYYISTIFLKNTTIRRRIEKIKNRSKSMDGALPRYFFLCQKYPATQIVRVRKDHWSSMICRLLIYSKPDSYRRNSYIGSRHPPLIELNDGIQ